MTCKTPLALWKLANGEENPSLVVFDFSISWQPQCVVSSTIKFSHLVLLVLDIPCVVWGVFAVLYIVQLSNPFLCVVGNFFLLVGYFPCCSGAFIFNLLIIGIVSCAI